MNTSFKTGTIGEGHNIFCTASPIIAQQSKAPGHLGVHQMKGGAKHPYWGIRGFFGNEETFARYNDDTAMCDAQEYNELENYGDNTWHYRKLALNGMCHNTATGHIVWTALAAENLLVEAMDEITEENDEAGYEAGRDSMLSDEWDYLQNNEELYHLEEEKTLLGRVEEKSTEHPQAGLEDWNEDKFQRGSTKYIDDPQYRWNNMWGEWMFVGKKKAYTPINKQVKTWNRSNHSEFVRTFCDASKSKCSCENIIRMNRKGEHYNVFPKWTWCKSKPLFGFKPAHKYELNVEEHRLVSKPARINDFYVEEESEAIHVEA
jgi:hypothetical protein